MEEGPIMRPIESQLERRQFIRLSYDSPLMYKICKKSTITKLLQGYTHNISQSGLMCTLNNRVPKASTLWLRLDTGALSLCEEIEKRSVIIQQGILGKVAWIKRVKEKCYQVGVRFITREEKHSKDFLLKQYFVD